MLTEQPPTEMAHQEWATSRRGIMARIQTILLRNLWNLLRVIHIGILVLLLLVLVNTHRELGSKEEKTEALDPVIWPTEPILKVIVNRTAEYENYRRSYPDGTDPEDPQPKIHITSLTIIQPPNNWHWMMEGSRFFIEQCPNLRPWMKCRYHQVATEEVIRKSHALLFHARHMNALDGNRTFRGLPKYRRPDQKWIFYEPEAPTNTWNYANRTDPYWKLFNLSATFTMDSNIPVQHHQRVCTPIPNWKPTGINYARDRKIAAWFVSHCTCSSKRELYVAEMMKVMKIDVYGDCGNASVCNRKSDVQADRCMLKLLNNSYKFYLSFENAFCAHYVTEKFHRIIAQVDVVPVVMGAADYTNILPVGSYIDYRDFSSPKALAEYLITVDRNDTLYNQYIEAKKAYFCRTLLPFACSLCEYLHNHRYELQVLYDARTFWSVEQRCTDPRYAYKGFANEIIPKIKYEIDPYLFL